MEAKCNIADVVISPEINHQKNTLRSLINVQSLITVQGVTLFYKKFKVSSGLGLETYQNWQFVTEFFYSIFPKSRLLKINKIFKVIKFKI